MITKSELLRGREKSHASEFTSAISRNLDALLQRVNVIRMAYGRPVHVNSGWRPPSINGATLGAAPHSNHMRGLAVDFRDDDGGLRNWCLANLAVLHSNGIWLEDFKWTPTWVHMQIVAPGSGRRIYPPHKGGAIVSNWDGKYDARFDGHFHSYSG